ncbi:MAG: hypothetical protein KAG14_03745 [Mycoplasmataceae bacterium]|nr:hypothetical protein [Mycoplasmataceae bacterium]
MALKLTLKEFIKKAKLKHGDKYDYFLVKYVNYTTFVEIICPVHGVFKQRPNNHLRSGCPKCGGNKKHTTKTFIEKSKIIHGDKYDYSLVEYKTNKDRVEIICPVHGMFKQFASNHMRGASCPICKESIGEKKIALELKKHKICFKREHRFPDCKNIQTLPFDFYIPSSNICIEYDGVQHFKPISFFGGKIAFEKRKINDNIKTDYCEKNNLKLIRVPYTEIKNIYKIFNILFSTII